jgi:hypothetical protein
MNEKNMNEKNSTSYKDNFLIEEYKFVCFKL